MSSVTSSVLSESDQEAIIAAAALSMGLNNNDVVITSYTATPANRRRTTVLRAADGVEALATTLYNVVVNIQTSVIVSNSAEAGTDYTAYSSLLTASNFNSQLSVTSSQYGASSLATASATTIQNDPYTYDTPSSSDDDTLSSNNDDDNLSGGAIAGIVIAVIVGVALFAGLAYYFTSSNSRSDNFHGESLLGGGGYRESAANRSTVDIKVDL